LPNRGDDYWTYTEKWGANKVKWKDEPAYLDLYRAGNVHKTEEAAEAWGAAQGEREESA
jgi:hypothetical protein